MDYPTPLPQPHLILRIHWSTDQPDGTRQTGMEENRTTIPEKDVKLFVQERVTSFMYSLIKTSGITSERFTDPRIDKIEVQIVTHARQESIASLALGNDFNNAIVSELRARRTDRK
jgi:hypothetical protein